jgi:hypothetical protein
MNEPASPVAKTTAISGTDLAGSLPTFPGLPGSGLADGQPLPDFRHKRLLFNRIRAPKQVHVYAAECMAGERLRVQSFVPVLPLGGAAVPAFAVVAQSLPYSADIKKLPLDLPAGYSAVVAPAPTDLVQPVEDMLTRVRYYSGPTIDTRMLVGGRCYIVVWSPQQHMGKYVLQIGHKWPTRVGYWLALPTYWWKIRGWFGVSRDAVWYAAAAVLALAATAWLSSRRASGRDHSHRA